MNTIFKLYQHTNILNFSVCERAYFQSEKYTRKLLVHNCSQYDEEITKSIKKFTRVSTNHLTPEIPLHLITPDLPAWHNASGIHFLNDAFWGFYWPGGQAISRFILDNPHCVKDKVVLDVGSGCGASAIACLKAKATSVVANDIDPVSLHATALNAQLNFSEQQVFLNMHMQNVKIIDDLLLHKGLKLSAENLLINSDHQFSSSDYDVVILGDMFYDEEIAKQVFRWLQCFNDSNNKSMCVLLADPGRGVLQNQDFKKHLHLLQSYPLNPLSRRENNGLTESKVFQFVF